MIGSATSAKKRFQGVSSAGDRGGELGASHVPNAYSRQVERIFVAVYETSLACKGKQKAALTRIVTFAIGKVYAGSAERVSERSDVNT